MNPPTPTTSAEPAAADLAIDPAIKPVLSLKRRLLRSALRLTIFVVVLFAALRWSAIVERVAFFNPATNTLRATPAEYEDVFFETPDGQRLHAWFMPARGRAPNAPPAPAILHCHGNMGDVFEHSGTSAYITRAGVSVLCFDYRGFGASTPAHLLTREDLLIDTQAAYDYLLTRPDVDKNRIGVFGYSLGGTYALDLAAHHPEIRCVASIATFSSWPEVACDFVPVLGRLLIRSGLAADDDAAALGTRPLLLVHGEKDEIVGFAHAGRILAAAKAAGVPVELLSVPKAHHLDIFNVDVKRRITEFFQKNLVDSK